MINDTISWSGRNTTIVFTGDVTDDRRFDTEKLFAPDQEHKEYDVVAILYFLLELNDEARLEGGQILICLGNHDYANLFENKYQKPYAFRQTYNSKLTYDYNESHLYNNDELKSKLACIFYPYILLNNKYMFMHGGLHPEFITKIQIVYDEISYLASMNEYNKDLKKILK